MDFGWLRIINWREFPEEIKQRCKAIAEEVANLGWPSNAIKRYAGSYSFQAMVDDDIWTVAKLIPQRPYGEPLVLATFRWPLPKAESYARKLHRLVEKRIVMHECFFVSRVPDDSDDCDYHQVAKTLAEFLHQCKPPGHTKIDL